MALEHAKPLEVIALHARDGMHISTSLIRTPQLQLLRLVLPPGHALPHHQVPGEATIHCLAGEAGISTRVASLRLVAGSVVLVPAGEPHDVHARGEQGCVLLVTVTMQPPPPE